MSRVRAAASQVLYLQLPEESYNKLAALCEQLQLMSRLTLAVTLEEAGEALQLSRSMLGLYFDSVAEQLGAVLEAVEQGGSLSGQVGRPGASGGLTRK